MIHFRQATIVIEGRTYELQADRITSFDTFYVDARSEVTTEEERWSFFLHPKQDLRLDRVEVQFALPMSAAACFFANGFQSWSESRLLPIQSGIPRLRGIAQSALGWYGDARIGNVPGGKGNLHSWTYTYFTDPGKASIMLGSLHEKSGFTFFSYNERDQVLTVRKDLPAQGLDIKHSFPILDFWVAKGPESALFDLYAALLEIPKPDHAHGLGWMNGVNTTSESQILHHLQSVVESGLPFRSIAINDGWQSAVGDWLNVGSSFPRGMAFLAKEIRTNGLVPSIWVAPFVAAKDAEIIRRNPNWVLKDAQGKAIRVGKNPSWGGWFYALDFYQPCVRDYLSGVFHVLADQWGFETFHADYLFAVCIAPPPGKTRGQVMHEALTFLKELVGNRQLVCGGVPLGSCIGLSDAVRICSPANASWKNRLHTWLHHRERSDTLAALHSTLGRWQWGQSFWDNATDVFTLRTEQKGLTPIQQHTVVTINALLGQSLFTSDDVSQYSPEQRAELESALELQGCMVTAVDTVANEVYRIAYLQAESSKVAFCNLSSKSVVVMDRQVAIELAAYETWV